MLLLRRTCRTRSRRRRPADAAVNGAARRSARIWCMRSRCSGLSCGLELGKRAQGFLLHVGAQLGELVDQRIDTRHVDGRPLVLGCELVAQFLDLAQPLAPGRGVLIEHTAQRLALAIVEIEVVRHRFERAGALSRRRRRRDARTAAVRSSCDRRSPRERTCSAAATGPAAPGSDARTCQMPSETRNSVNSLDVSVELVCGMFRA